MKIQNQTVVKHEERVGVVCDDDVLYGAGRWHCLAPDETLVVFEGVNYGEVVRTADLKIIGRENAVPVPELCGAGRGDECCIFLTCGPDGFCCERFSKLRNTLVTKRDMSAKRNPTEMFPHCQFKKGA